MSAPRPLAPGAALLIAAASAAVLLVSNDDAEAGATHTVYVNDTDFCAEPGVACSQPYALQITPGDTVQWLDGEPGFIPHTVTQCTGDGTGCPAPGGFDSSPPKTDPADPYLTQMFPDEGTIYFRCQVHGNSMRGIITVGQPASPTASPSPTASATAPATPGPSSSPARSDVTCDGETDGNDVLALLLHRDGGAPAAPAGSGCPPLGSEGEGGRTGDLNCDGAVGAADALVALRVWADLPVDACGS